MRLLSRLSAWLRARPESDAQQSLFAPSHQRGLDAALLSHVPQSTADVFRRLLLSGVETAHAQGRALLVELDPSVTVLVIPRADPPTKAREDALGHDIDLAIKHIEGRGRSYSSVTWSALKDARPPFEPTYREWGGESAWRFEGEMGLVFFVDVEAMACAVCLAADAEGLSARVADEGAVVKASDGRYEANIAMSALLAEALWTGIGPYAAIHRRTRGLPGEMRAYATVQKGLERRFPGVRFEPRGDHIAALTATAAHRIQHGHVAAAFRHAGGSLDAWLSRCRLEDLLGGLGDPALLVRAKAYGKARPDALWVAEDEHVLAAVRDDDGRAVPIARHDDDPPGRMDHFREEALRQLPFFHQESWAFVVEDGLRRAAVLVGENVATLALHESLVKGALEQLLPPDARVRVKTLTEDTLIIALLGSDPSSDAATVDGVIAEAARRAALLEGDLHDDTSDALAIDRVMELPAVGHGRFDFTLVPDGYFELRLESLQRQKANPIHADYLHGVALELLGRLDPAVALLEKAAQRAIHDGEIILALGRTLSATGDHARALPFLEKAIRSFPDDAEVQNALGVAHYRSGDVPKARAAFQTAVKLAPDDVNFLVNLGKTCCDEQMWGEAKAALEHALRVEPQSAEAHASMAVLLHRTGSRQEALRHAREALATEADDDTVRELMKLTDDE